MDFIPATEEEIEKERNQPRDAGLYDFTCTEAEEGESQNSGNPQFKVKLKCFDDKGSFFVYDYLQPGGKMRFKLKHFCDSVGLADKYEKGSLAAFDLLDKSGKVELVIQAGNEKYPNPRNSVRDYHDRQPSQGLSSLPNTSDADVPEWMK
jgi:hypothetical protein